MQFRIVRVKSRKFFGSHGYRAGESQVEVTDREKTIVDCLDRPDLSGGLDQVGKALLAGDGDFDWDRTTMYLRRFGSGAVVKRCGFLVETLGLTHPPEPRMLDEWLDLRTAGISKLDPSHSKRAPSDRHTLANRGQSPGGRAAEAAMIRDAEIRRDARLAGVEPRTMELDYALGMGPSGESPATPTWPGDWSSRAGPA